MTSFQYYKPWELRPEEKSQIELQVNQVEETLRPQDQGPARHTPEQETENSTVLEEVPPQEKDSTDATDGVVNATNETEEPIITQSHDTNTSPDGPGETGRADASQEATKDNVDEGGDDIVEGEEDAVIY